MRDTSVGKSHAMLAGQEVESGIEPEFANRLKVDFRYSVSEMPGHHPGIGLKMTLPIADYPQLPRQPDAAERGVATELANATISVEVAYPK